MSGNTEGKPQERIAVLAFDGFDALQVSGIVAAVTSVGHTPVIIGSRTGSAYPRGVEQGDDKAAGVVQATSTIDAPESFSALFVPDGDEGFVSQLESEQGLRAIRDSARNFQTSKSSLHFSSRFEGSIPALANELTPCSLRDFEQSELSELRCPS